MFAYRRDRARGIHTAGTFPTVVHDDLVPSVRLIDGDGRAVVAVSDGGGRLDAAVA